MRDSVSEQKARKRLKEQEKSTPRVGPADNLDAVCERMMLALKKRYRSQKSEISPHMLTKECRRFARGYGLNENMLLDALIRRGWVEPSAGNAWLIRYDLVRR